MRPGVTGIMRPILIASSNVVTSTTITITLWCFLGLLCLRSLSGIYSFHTSAMPLSNLIIGYYKQGRLSKRPWMLDNFLIRGTIYV